MSNQNLVQNPFATLATMFVDSKGDVRDARKCRSSSRARELLAKRQKESEEMIAARKRAAEAIAIAKEMRAYGVTSELQLKIAKARESLASLLAEREGLYRFAAFHISMERAGRATDVDLESKRHYLGKAAELSKAITAIRKELVVLVKSTVQ